MLMPEAAVYEDHLSEPRENEIGRAGKVSPVKAKPETHAMNKPADDHLRLRIRLANTTHTRTQRVSRGLGCHTSFYWPSSVRNSLARPMDMLTELT